MQHMLATNNWGVCVCVCMCVCDMHFFLHRKSSRLVHSGETSGVMALHFL